MLLAVITLQNLSAHKPFLAAQIARYVEDLGLQGLTVQRTGCLGMDTFCVNAVSSSAEN